MRVAGIPLGVGQQQQQQQQQIDGQTMLLMLFEGANGSTIFTDSSSKNNTINRFGSPSITTSNSKFGNSCLGINANSYLKINKSENFDIGAGQPFTIQMWLYITGGTGAYGGLISMRDAPVYCPIEVNITNNGTLATKIGNATLTDWDSSSFTMSTYVWRHFAIVGDGSLIKVYNHGVMQNVAIAQPAWPNDEYLFQISRNGDNQMQSCAYIDYLSFHKAAFWLSDFTPPTAPFSSSGGMITVLDLQFNGADNSAIIDSTGRHTPSLSASGTRAILNNQLNLASNGFIRADAQNTANADFDFTSCDFEIECKVTKPAGSNGYIWCHTANDGALGMCLKFASNNTIEMIDVNNSLMITHTAASTFVGRQAKIKAARVAGIYTLYVDDILVATDARNWLTGSNGLVIGNYPSSSGGGLNGQIDDFIVRRTF